MKQSLTFYILLLVLKLKGVKKDFSQNPIDFKRIRKGDVRAPRLTAFAPSKATTFKVAESTITEVKKASGSKGLVLFVHGGAFVSGPTDLHWNAIKKITANTNQTVWLCDYPKSPENQMATIAKNIDQVFEKALEQYEPGNITLLGDSVGGTLITALTQRLIQKNQQPPRKLILVSPVMDSTMSNPNIDEVDARDPMLSKAGVLSAKKMCAGEMDLKNEMLSPIYGSFHGFPKTVLFLAENDIMYPDQLLALQKLQAAGVDLKVIEGKNMPHIWPILPVMKEANVAMKHLIRQL